MSNNQFTREELIKAQKNQLVFQWFDYMVENPNMTMQIIESGSLVPPEFAIAFDALLAMAED